MDQKKIDRINALARKAKAEGLTPEEEVERAALRREYIDSVVGNLKQQLGTERAVFVQSTGKEDPRRRGLQRRGKPLPIDRVGDHGDALRGEKKGVLQMETQILADRNRPIAPVADKAQKARGTEFRVCRDDLGAALAGEPANETGGQPRVCVQNREALPTDQTVDLPTDRKQAQGIVGGKCDFDVRNSALRKALA